MNHSKLVIQGGYPINGEIKVHGAKNSSLPILAACLLVDGTTALHNCPNLSDVYSACRILTNLGCHVKRQNDALLIDAQTLGGCEIDEELMRKMRSSIVFLGAILARMGHCKLSFPGGCELGSRPIDIHLAAMRQLGVEIDEKYGTLDCTLCGSIRSGDVVLPFPSVGATENIILLAALSDASVTIVNAAREPEITDLADFINACGGDVRGAGSPYIHINGVKELHPCEYVIMPDRIVAATYLAASAITSGEIMLLGARAGDMQSTLCVYEQMGCMVRAFDDKIYLRSHIPLRPIKTLKTLPYPGFATDCQPIIMACMCKCDGTSVIYENIFENRYRAAPELIKMGADITLNGKVAVIEGKTRLYGAKVVAADLRAGASLIVAALAAEGETRITNVCYIDRGYEEIEKNLSSLGGNIKRI